MQSPYSSARKVCFHVSGDSLFNGKIPTFVFASPHMTSGTISRAGKPDPPVTHSRRRSDSGHILNYKVWETEV